jgi:hypothetical protein
MNFKDFFKNNSNMNSANSVNSVFVIFESFDTPVKVKYQIEKEKNSTVHRGYFNIDDKKFMILIEILNEERAMLVNFYQNIDNLWVEKRTENLSKEEVLSVFSTLINEVQRFLKDCNFLILQPNESKKFTIYNQLVKRFNSKDEFNTSTDGKSIFLERKDKTLNISIFKKLKNFKVN